MNTLKTAQLTNLVTSVDIHSCLAFAINNKHKSQFMVIQLA